MTVVRRGARNVSPARTADMPLHSRRHRWHDRKRLLCYTSLCLGAILSDGGSVGTVESLGIGADYGIAPNQLVKEVLWKALTDRRSVMRE